MRKWWQALKVTARIMTGRISNDDLKDEINRVRVSFGRNPIR